MTKQGKKDRLTIKNDGLYIVIFVCKNFRLTQEKQGYFREWLRIDMYSGNDKPFMELKRNTFLEKGFELFSEKGIEAVTMQDVAQASGYGVATLYRYFNSKPELVIAIAVRKWDEYLSKNSSRNSEGGTAAEVFAFYLDSFVDLYRNQRNMLRFNQFFNIFLQTEKIDAETMEPYQKVIRSIADRFHAMYERGKSDHTLRVDIPEEKMFSLTLHLMLAAATRYAVGLVYQPYPDYDPGTELEILRDVLYEKYTLMEQVPQRLLILNSCRKTGF